MKKLFISQPMNGKTDEEILYKRKEAIKAAEKILNEEVEVIDSFYEDFSATTTNEPLEILARSIKDLAKADIAYFVKGWEKTRGCKIEYECAKEYGIKIFTEETDQCLWSFCWDCCYGKLEGVFKATKKEIEYIIGKEADFGEVLGKHSEVSGIIEKEDVTLESEDPLVVELAVESGYNPLDYILVPLETLE